MKHIIVGTAGHVDHGKSTLIRALTGIEPDRLKEEQKRGLTIDIGFAYFDLPSGRRAGIVDVPGHEKFIKNMLAGAIGFDVVILVIAADEGIMPQTQEHLNILSFLGIEKGVIALTKTDLVEAEWTELITEEIKEKLKGTFLEKAPIIPIAAMEGIGLEELSSCLDTLTGETVSRNQEAPFRLPIDRAFTIKGFGTVVTGTLIEGQIKVSQSAEIKPLSKETKIRNIQIHGEKSDIAYAGQRVALNLVNVSIEDCQRGQVLAKEGLLETTMMLDVSFKLLDDAKRPLNHWDRVRVHIGTSEVLARVALIGKEHILPGEKALLQLRLEEELAVLRGDNYVLRSYSPLVTIGGGEVIDPNPNKKKRFSEEVLEALELKAHGSNREILLNEINNNKKPVLSEKEIIDQSALRNASEILKNLIKTEDIGVVESTQKYYYSSQVFKDINSRLVDVLSKYHKKWPLRPGIQVAEINSRFAKDVNSRTFKEFINKVEELGDLKIRQNYLALAKHNIVFAGKDQELHKQILKAYQEQAFAPLEPQKLAEDLMILQQDCKEVIDAMNLLGETIKIDQDFYLLKSFYEKAQKAVVHYFQANESLDLGEFRTLLDTSRKYALPLLEHFDYIGLTKRKSDNTRVLNK